MDPTQDQLTSLMSHADLQLRKRLTVLLPAIDLLERHLFEAGSSDTQSHRFIAEARRSAFSILRLSNNMRDYAKALEGYALPESQVFCLAAMIRRLVCEAKKAGM